MSKIKADSHSTAWTTVRKASLYLAFILVILMGLFIYRHYHNQLTLTGHPSAAEQSNLSETRQLLASHDYYNYQLNVTTFADNYTTLKQYSQAENDLNQIISNVPHDKITSDTYRSFWYLYKQKGDTANRKKYALLTAQKLKQEGNVNAATTFEQDANN